MVGMVYFEYVCEYVWVFVCDEYREKREYLKLFSFIELF